MQLPELAPFVTLNTLIPLRCPAGLFGQQQQQPQATGTRNLPYQTTSLTDVSKPNERQNFKTICAMPQYSSKSVEELRWEDYQVKGGQIVGLGLDLAGAMAASAALEGL